MIYCSHCTSFHVFFSCQFRTSLSAVDVRSIYVRRLTLCAALLGALALRAAAACCAFDMQ